MPTCRVPRLTRAQRSQLLEDVHEYGANVETREIFLTSPPDSPADELDHRVATRFIKNLTLLNHFNHQPILIHLNMCGGFWEYGMTIFDAIKASPSPTTMLAYAESRSMSSIVPQACRRRVIMPNAIVMVHFGTLALEGDSRSVLSCAKHCEEIDERMLDIYVTRAARAPFFRRRKRSKAQVKDWFREHMNIKREVYFTATEAVQYGLMDGVFGQAPFRSINDLLCF